MMEDNKQLALRIDGAIQSASQEVTNLRAELTATNRRLAELSGGGSSSGGGGGGGGGGSCDSSIMENNHHNAQGRASPPTPRGSERPLSPPLRVPDPGFLGSRKCDLGGKKNPNQWEKLFISGCLTVCALPFPLLPSGGKN
uniref:Kazrin, periplakin interacting protein n=1 Tax=Vombatus ursinus TaxID=29139 RepID=A0A4X2JQN4_VOMUR